MTEGTAVRFERIRLEKSGPVAALTLANPANDNLLDGIAQAEIRRAFVAVKDDPGIRALVVAAEGRMFSAGADFALMGVVRSDERVRQTILNSRNSLLSAFLDIDVPVVFALHGDVVGVFATLAVASEAVVSHPACLIHNRHVGIGLVSGDGAPLVWAAHIGLLNAKRNLLLAESIRADRAYEMGAVTDLVASADEVLPAARVLAERFSALPSARALKETKRAFNSVLRQRIQEAGDLLAAAEYVAIASPEHVDAVEAELAARATGEHPC